MKKSPNRVRFASVLSFVVFGTTSAFSQSNSLPSNGNVGIGTTNPTTKLQVNGSARIDSTLTVKDSVIINKDAHVKQKLTVDNKVVMKNDATVKQNFKVEGESTLNGNTTIKSGDFKIKPLADTTATEDGILTIAPNGKVKNGGDVKSLVYGTTTAQLPCLTDLNGNIVYGAPTWQHGPQQMYILNNNCIPDVKLGVGVIPTAKFHIKTSTNTTTTPILVEKTISGNQTPYKLLQLDNTGLLYAREIKVNLDSWPDYVFDSTYALIPLEDVKAYIEANNHLPGVPNACEMEEQGVNIAETSTMLMEKVEELTLYMIQLQEQLKAQQLLLEQQQALIQQLSEKQ